MSKPIGLTKEEGNWQGRMRRSVETPSKPINPREGRIVGRGRQAPQGIASFASLGCSMSIAINSRKNDKPRSSRRRAAWRQWLIEAERGITAGFRSDSIFFVHLFVGSLTVATAAMLGLSRVEWAILVLAICSTIAAELFHQVLKQLGDLVQLAGVKRAHSIRRFGVAAVAVVTLGSGLSIGILIFSRLWGLLVGAG